MLRLDHVGIATADIDRLLELLRDLLGETRYSSETLERDGVRISFASVDGAQLELLEALDDASPLARFLRKRKGGLHHLAFEVEDIYAMHRRVREAGYAPIDPAPRPGAGGKAIFFLHPGQTSNVLIEFCARAEPCLKPVDGPFPEGVRRMLRAAGSAARTPLLHISAASPVSPDPHALAQRLAPGRICVVAETARDPDIPALIDRVGFRAVHLLAQGAHPATVLRAARAEARIRAIVWTDPDVFGDAFENVLEAATTLPAGMLFLTGDSEAGLDAAGALRRRYPSAAVAAASDPALRMAIVEQHLAAQAEPSAP